MNAAVRAVVRAALHHGIEVYAIYEGYQGMVAGGELIRRMQWSDVGGIMHRGGTVIGTARSAAFRTREGRLAAAHNLIEREIDSLVVIGGDGSLTGANLFRQEWPELLATLVAEGRIGQDIADRHPHLAIAGLVGSIDNDMFGTDMTIGADTALRRITDAIDAISSTAASHQRSFVVEVMGRNCGYLALMSALATGAEWVLIPEYPPAGDTWEDTMCRLLQKGRAAGRRDTIVVVAEGARDRDGNPITSAYVQKVLEERLGEDTRVTILGHVQRGGSPSPFDRNLSTILGYAAVDHLMAHPPADEPLLFGMRGNRIVSSPLMHCVEQTHAVAAAIAAKDYERAMALRGTSFFEAFRTHRTLMRALPHPRDPARRQRRFGVFHAGGLAPGMNTAVRAAVRLGLDRGHTIVGIRNGFEGLIAGQLVELEWGMVNGWAGFGGSELGTNRYVLKDEDLPAVARTLEEHALDGLLMIGGMPGYQGAHLLWTARERFKALNIPIVCLPATISNDLPGSELSIGADTALNSIIDAVDKIKQSAVAYNRCYIVEVMGRACGYLALMSGLASGAERVYLHEEGVTLRDLQADLAQISADFTEGKRLGLVIRNEYANPVYTTGFIAALFEEEAGGLFDVRQAILGHLQQGGNPSPFDRIQATRLSAKCLEFLIGSAERPEPLSSFAGLAGGEVQFHDLVDFPRMLEARLNRPETQWWMGLRPIARMLANPPSMTDTSTTLAS
jgi:6-phosphofructokinase 1